MLPVVDIERRALHQKDFFLQQQIQYQLFIIHDGEAPGVQLWEQIERALGFHAAYARNIVEHPPGCLPLLAEPSARGYQVVDGLVAAQRRLDGELGWHIGTQAHVGEHLNALGQVFGAVFGAADDHPA